MANRKTFLTALMIIIAYTTALSLSYTEYNSQFRGSTLVSLLIILSVAITFSVSALLMLAWDTDDKIPPILMLCLGLFGMAMWLMVAFFKINWQIGQWSVSFTFRTAHAINALFIAFGTIGLLAKRKTD